MATAAYFGMIYVLFTFTVAAGRPPFVRSVNIDTTEFIHEIQCRLFVGIERMGPSAPGMFLFLFYRSQRVPTKSKPKSISTENVSEITATQNENTISVNVRINKTQRVRARTPNPVDTESF